MKQPVEFNFWEANKNKFPKVQPVICMCDICDEKFNRLAYQISEKNKHICKFCRSYSSAHPKEMIKNLKLNKDSQTIDFEFFSKYRVFGSKYFVEFCCEKCEKTTKIMWNTLKQRDDEITGNKKICVKCNIKALHDNKIWRERNSAAQLIAQNKPEQIKKNRDAQVKRYHDHPEKRVAMSIAVKKMHLEKPYVLDKIAAATRKNWLNDDYRIKQERSNKQVLTGRYYDLFFGSSYELSFIVFCLTNDIRIKRCDFKLNYTDSAGQKRYYFPDYVVEYDQFGNKTIVEIKGARRKNIEFKKQAAEKFCNIDRRFNYELLFLDDLKLKSVKMITSVTDLKTLDREKLIIYNIPKGWKREFRKNYKNLKKRSQRQGL